MKYPHTVVWIDHFNAEVVHYTPDEYHREHFESTREDRRLHRKSGIPGAGHQPDDVELYAKVADDLDRRSMSVLIVGPGTAKDSLERYLRDERPSVWERVAAVDTVNHPSINQLLAFARRRFTAIDQLAGDPAREE